MFKFNDLMIPKLNLSAHKFSENSNWNIIIKNTLKFNPYIIVNISVKKL